MFDKLEFIFIEDKPKFDGASKEEQRAHFQEWVADSFSAENPRADQKLLYDNEPVARYRFFFEINEDALRSHQDGLCLPLFNLLGTEKHNVGVMR